MKVSLKQWKEVEAIVSDLKKRMHAASAKILLIADQFKFPEPEFQTLHAIAWDIQRAEEQVPASAQLHPQSEWVGGNSDDPKNHKLREPNICPMPRRHFTPEEIAEARAVCNGPCQWDFKPPEV